VKVSVFYAKRTQFCAFLAQKQRFVQKTKPIQTQSKPILAQKCSFKPKNKPKTKPNLGSLGKIEKQIIIVTAAVQTGFVQARGDVGSFNEGTSPSFGAK
jgi:hypothetical protein